MVLKNTIFEYACFMCFAEVPDVIPNGSGVWNRSLLSCSSDSDFSMVKSDLKKLQCTFCTVIFLTAVSWMQTRTKQLSDCDVRIQVSPSVFCNAYPFFRLWEVI